MQNNVIQFCSKTVNKGIIGTHKYKWQQGFSKSRGIDDAIFVISELVEQFTGFYRFIKKLFNESKFQVIKIIE